VRPEVGQDQRCFCNLMFFEVGGHPGQLDWY
jgi:hypothetical protein